jgi:hypothetical protein
MSEKIEEGIEYSLENPDKYIGKPPVYYHSVEELAYYKRFDTHDSVLRWAVKEKKQKKDGSFNTSIAVEYIHDNAKHQKVIVLGATEVEARPNNMDSAAGSNNSRYKQGEFTPKNPDKYVGTYPIIFRSSWEETYCKFLDGNPNVIEWSSESLIIPYIKPTDNAVHRYFPDFYIKYKDVHGKIHEEIIEVKPLSQAKKPKVRKKPTAKGRANYLEEQITYDVNQAKWKAATEFCKARGMEFRVITEKDIFK